MTDLTLERPNVAVVEEQTNKELRLHVIKEWSTRLSSDNKPTAIQHLEYIILRGLLVKGNPDYDMIFDRAIDGFGPITNIVKLENGRTQYDTLKHNCYMLFSSKTNTFNVPEDVFDEVREVANDIRLDF